MPFKKIKKTILNNGITLIMEEDRNVPSVSIGVLIKSGSKYEMPENNGISHFAEHIIFKGTKKRTAEDIAISIDEIGGQIDGGTSREYTHFDIRALSQHLELTIDILSDLIYYPRLDIDDIRNEQKVVLEEIKMYEDSPDDYIHDIIVSEIWKGSQIGQPILGTRKTVMSFNRTKLKEFISKYYVPSQMIISVCGNFNTPDLIKLIKKYFSVRPKTVCRHNKIKMKKYYGGRKHIERDLSQVHCCIGFPGVSRKDSGRFVLNVMNVIMGNSMSSRLFQEVREKKGLVYSVYSYPVFCEEAGLYNIYFATTHRNFKRAYDTIMVEIEKIKEFGVSEEELIKGKENLKGNLLLSLETTKARMSILGRWELYYRKSFTMKEIVDEINRITINDLQKLACKILNNDKSMTVTLGKKI